MRDLLQAQIDECRSTLNRLSKRLKAQLRVGGKGAATASAHLAAANLKLAGALGLDLAGPDADDEVGTV